MVLKSNMRPGYVVFEETLAGTLQKAVFERHSGEGNNFFYSEDDAGEWVEKFGHFKKTYYLISAYGPEPYNYKFKETEI